MSATNRGAVREDRDFYATPREAFEPLLPYLPKDKLIWEPACGDGRLIAMMQQYGLRADGTGLALGDDFLKDQTRRECQLTNPPFTLAQAFCDHALELSTEVWMLLRLNFLASEERKQWWKEHEPQALFVLSSRPSFVMSCGCKAMVDMEGNVIVPADDDTQWEPCAHRWTLSADSARPKSCPKCGNANRKLLTVSTTDATDYAWFYWDREPRHVGVYHL